MLWNSSSIVSQWPYGLQTMSRLLVNGRAIVGRLLQEYNLLGVPVWDAWPRRVGRANGWLVIDTEVIGMSKLNNWPDFRDQQAKRYANLDTSPLRHSLDNGIRLMDRLYQARDTAPQGNTADLLRAAKALRFLSDFDQEAWQQQVSKTLAAFGEPTRVLAPQKVLRSKA